jgi:ABC-type lipoprotein export system ATPase subunit
VNGDSVQGRSEKIVEAEDLHRRYGEGEAAVEALAGITVAFPVGRYAAIMGPSGWGKSTLGHILAGLDRATSGSVLRSSRPAGRRAWTCSKRSQASSGALARRPAIHS